MPSQAVRRLVSPDVALEFVDELVGAIKLDLRAQEADEFDANLVVVQVDPFFSDAVGPTTLPIKAGFSPKVGLVPMEMAAGQRFSPIYQPTGIDAVDRKCSLQMSESRLAVGNPDGAATPSPCTTSPSMECGSTQNGVERPGFGHEPAGSAHWWSSMRALPLAWFFFVHARRSALRHWPADRRALPSARGFRLEIARNTHFTWATVIDHISSNTPVAAARLAICFTSPSTLAHGGIPPKDQRAHTQLAGESAKEENV